jgi:hypothetical protein
VYAAIKDKETSEVSPWARRLLGREPEDFQTTVGAMMQR